MRQATVLAFSAALLVIFAVFAAAVRQLDLPKATSPKSQGENLQVARLATNERLVISYQSHARDVSFARLYQIDGGTVRSFAATALETESGDTDRRARRNVHQLSEADCVGLDAYVLFLRHPPPGPALHRRDDIRIGYYRDGALIGEENFRDQSGLLPITYPGLEDAPAPSEEWCPPGFPLEVFREIMPPWVIERKFLPQS